MIPSSPIGHDQVGETSSEWTERLRTELLEVSLAKSSLNRSLRFAALKSAHAKRTNFFDSPPTPKHSNQSTQKRGSSHRRDSLIPSRADADNKRRNDSLTRARYDCEEADLAVLTTRLALPVYKDTREQKRHEHGNQSRQNPLHSLGGPDAVEGVSSRTSTVNGGHHLPQIFDQSLSEARVKINSRSNSIQYTDGIPKSENNSHHNKEGSPARRSVKAVHRHHQSNNADILEERKASSEKVAAPDRSRYARHTQRSPEPPPSCDGELNERAPRRHSRGNTETDDESVNAMLPSNLRRREKYHAEGNEISVEEKPLYRVLAVSERGAKDGSRDEEREQHPGIGAQRVQPLGVGRGAVQENIRANSKVSSVYACIQKGSYTSTSMRMRGEHKGIERGDKTKSTLYEVKAATNKPFHTPTKDATVQTNALSRTRFATTSSDTFTQTEFSLVHIQSEEDVGTADLACKYAVFPSRSLLIEEDAAVKMSTKVNHALSPDPADSRSSYGNKRGTSAAPTHEKETTEARGSTADAATTTKGLMNDIQGEFDDGPVPLQWESDTFDGVILAACATAGNVSGKIILANEYDDDRDRDLPRRKRQPKMVSRSVVEDLDRERGENGGGGKSTTQPSSTQKAPTCLKYDQALKVVTAEKNTEGAEPPTSWKVTPSRYGEMHTTGGRGDVFHRHCRNDDGATPRLELKPKPSKETGHCPLNRSVVDEADRTRRAQTDSTAEVGVAVGAAHGAVNDNDTQDDVNNSDDDNEKDEDEDDFCGATGNHEQLMERFDRELEKARAVLQQSVDDDDAETRPSLNSKLELGAIPRGWIVPGGRGGDVSSLECEESAATAARTVEESTSLSLDFPHQLSSKRADASDNRSQDGCDENDNYDYIDDDDKEEEGSVAPDPPMCPYRNPEEARTALRYGDESDAGTNFSPNIDRCFGAASQVWVVPDIKEETFPRGCEGSTTDDQGVNCIEVKPHGDKGISLGRPNRSLSTTTTTSSDEYCQDGYDGDFDEDSLMQNPLECLNQRAKEASVEPQSDYGGANGEVDARTLPSQSTDAIRQSWVAPVHEGTFHRSFEESAAFDRMVDYVAPKTHSDERPLHPPHQNSGMSVTSSDEWSDSEHDEDEDEDEDDTVAPNPPSDPTDPFDQEMAQEKEKRKPNGEEGERSGNGATALINGENSAIIPVDPSKYSKDSPPIKCWKNLNPMDESSKGEEGSSSDSLRKTSVNYADYIEKDDIDEENYGRGWRGEDCNDAPVNDYARGRQSNEYMKDYRAHIKGEEYEHECDDEVDSVAPSPPAVSPRVLASSSPSYAALALRSASSPAGTNETTTDDEDTPHQPPPPSPPYPERNAHPSPFGETFGDVAERGAMCEKDTGELLISEEARRSEILSSSPSPLFVPPINMKHQPLNESTLVGFSASRSFSSEKSFDGKDTKHSRLLPSPIDSFPPRAFGMAAAAQEFHCVGPSGSDEQYDNNRDSEEQEAAVRNENVGLNIADVYSPSTSYGGSTFFPEDDVTVSTATTTTTSTTATFTTTSFLLGGRGSYLSNDFSIRSFPRPKERRRLRLLCPQALRAEGTVSTLYPPS